MEVRSPLPPRCAGRAMPCLHRPRSEGGSKSNQPRHVLVDEALVVRFQGLHVGDAVALGVKIKLVKLADPRQHGLVLLALKLLVRVPSVPWVEGVKPYHVHAFVWNCCTVVAEHLVEVFVVPPREHQVIKAAAFLVDPKLGAVHRMLAIGAVLKSFREDNCWRRRTANNIGISDGGPLGLAVKCHDLAEVVNQPRQVEPVLVRMLLPDALGGLEGVHNVGKICVGIALIHHLVEQVERPHRVQLKVVKFQPLRPHLFSVRHRLLGVHFSVCPTDAILRRWRLVVDSKSLLALVLRAELARVWHEDKALHLRFGVHGVSGCQSRSKTVWASLTPPK
mmetsp:Transcript_7539/g.19429  ORF Transcript_7539/g.19429 Transcript_7539/m.19429 type:complete len:335 (+) Transcript_7539:455-1459(+)